jgi:hypothetical protein
MSWYDLIFLCKKMMFFKAKKKKKRCQNDTSIPKKQKTNPRLRLLTRLGLISSCNLNNIDKKCNDNK